MEATRAALLCLSPCGGGVRGAGRLRGRSEAHTSVCRGGVAARSVLSGAAVEQWAVPPLEGEAVRAVPRTRSQALALLDSLLQEIRAQAGVHCGVGCRVNVVAFSGGVDSSLTAFLVHKALSEQPNIVCAACIGRSPSLATWQLETARSVASHIGIPLWEVDTSEGDIDEYVANEGVSCYHCKHTLYSTLQAVGARAALQAGFASGAPGHSPSPSAPAAAATAAATPAAAAAAAAAIPSVTLFNGTNADDLTDPTRLGLLAALRFNVVSPLASLPKAAVRAVAQAAGLPNWDLAASPCLRSRLQLSVPATPILLTATGLLEQQVRQLLGLPSQHSLRVRVLKPLWEAGPSVIQYRTTGVDSRGGPDEGRREHNQARGGPDEGRREHNHVECGTMLLIRDAVPGPPFPVPPFEPGATSPPAEKATNSQGVETAARISHVEAAAASASSLSARQQSDSSLRDDPTSQTSALPTATAPLGQQELLASASVPASQVRGSSGIEGYTVLVEVSSAALSTARLQELSLRQLSESYGAVFGGVREFKSGSMSGLPQTAT